MKHKLPTFVRLALFCLAAAAIMVTLFSLADRMLDGLFADWFERTFTVVSFHEHTATGVNWWTRDIVWSKLKDAVFWALVGGSALTAALMFAAGEWRRHRTVSEISKLLRSYEAGRQSDFPRDYAEIAAHLAELRAAMLQSEQALRTELSRKNDLVAYLAHDLKTPLTSVIGYLSLMDEANDMPDAQRAKYTRIALDKACRLDGLVDEFFEIARYDMQQMPLQTRRIDLHYMLLQLIDEFYPLLSARGNTAQLHADEDLTVQGDPEKLARVFNNILKNAAAYSDEGSVIRIFAGQRQGAVTVTVTNQGPTIPQSRLNMIFEKFYRLDAARGTVKGGAGLGLAIAKEIVTLHGGTISADSRENTTTFTVTLPAS